ncbi:hypothetical protein [Sphingobacterium sp. DR205]|uniref:hypothetical protein n=1 Tax=Sphingobacterium sp. DR205 TaxID=2713573 RepID=UPI0013E4BEFB|nr:hypothetical protein [Sphingobacterium sp. DR205]QIH34492.1 hypothetical protein G6053_17055 [Sphingobacterium sp. DR205]
MEFNIEKTVSEEAKEKNKVIFSLEEDVAKYLRSKDYGKDIKTYTIKLNCVNPPKGFEHLFKLLPPKYIDLKVSKNISTGQEQEFKKHFFCSINLIGEYYNEFVNSSDEESKKLLGREIIKSFSYLDKLPKKLKDFDKEKFKIDVENFFKDVGII